MSSWESNTGESELWCPDCGYQYRLVTVVDRKKTNEMRIAEGISLKEKFPIYWKRNKNGKFFFKSYFYDEGQRKKKKELDFNKKTLSFSKEQIIAERMYLDGYRIKNIVAAAGVSLKTICRWANKYGWELQYRREYENKLKSIEPDNYFKVLFKRSHRFPKRKSLQKLKTKNNHSLKQQ